MGNVKAAWWLIAAGACREAVERLGGFAVPEARAAATDEDLKWARGAVYGLGGGGDEYGGGGLGGGFGGGLGDGIGGGSGYGGNGFGDGGGGVEVGGGGVGNGFGGNGFGGNGSGGGVGSADIVSITIDGETMTPAECRERVRRWGA